VCKVERFVLTSLNGDYYHYFMLYFALFIECWWVIDIDEAGMTQQAGVGWFIILMCIIVLLLIILIIACIVQRRRGQMYPGRSSFNVLPTFQPASVARNRFLSYNYIAQLQMGQAVFIAFLDRFYLPSTDTMRRE